MLLRHGVLEDTPHAIRSGRSGGDGQYPHRCMGSSLLGHHPVRSYVGVKRHRAMLGSKAWLADVCEIRRALDDEAGLRNWKNHRSRNLRWRLRKALAMARTTDVDVMCTLAPADYHRPENTGMMIVCLLPSRVTKPITRNSFGKECTPTNQRNIIDHFPLQLCDTLGRERLR